MISLLLVPTIVGVPIKQFPASLTVVAASTDWINIIGEDNGGRRISPTVIVLPITKVTASIIDAILVLVVVVVLALR
jgi:hypothetical protein